MKHHYSCIRDRIPEDPKWFDENGCPRYAQFNPQDSAEFYANESALLLVECQSCSTQFNVCISRNKHDLSSEVSESIISKSIHYGDPPNVYCCACGPSQNSIPIRVLEYWKFNGEWQRDTSLEIQLQESAGSQ